MCCHLFFPFKGKSNHFSYQTFMEQYARQGNCFCLMFMYCLKRGSPVCSGGRGKARLMIRAQEEEEGRRKERKQKKKEILKGENLR